MMRKLLARGSAPLLFWVSPLLPATAPLAAPPETRLVRLEGRVLEFAPTRDDLAVGIAVFGIYGPKVLRVNGKEPASTWTSLELKEVGRNRFEMPALSIEYSEEDGGFLCLSVKVWFDRLANEFDSPFYERTDDRYALASYCTSDPAANRTARARFRQNRAATLEEFEKALAGPIAVRLTERRVPAPGLAFAEDGTLCAFPYFSELPIGERNQLWKLAPGGEPERMPLTGRRAAPWRIAPHGLAAGPGGVLYLSGLLHITSDGEVVDVPHPPDTAPAAPEAAIACDREGRLYFSIGSPRRGASPARVELARLDSAGKLEVLAGSVVGHHDGPGQEARFLEITAIAIGPAGEVYLADGRARSGSWLRRVNRSGRVVTVAGGEETGFADGRGAAARFRTISSVAVGPHGAVYAADRFNGAVRKITPEGDVTTLAGRGSSCEGEGLARDAAFEDPAAVAVAPNGDIFVLDGGPKRVRIWRISPDGRIAAAAVIP